MYVLLHTDQYSDGSPAMLAHLEEVLGEALSRFGDRITRVQVQLTDLHRGAVRAGFTDIHCLFDARLSHGQSIVVNHEASSAHLAIAGAVRKLKRAVGGAIAAHDPRHHQRRVDAAELRADDA